MKSSKIFELKGPYKINKNREISEVKNPKIIDVTLFTKSSNKRIKIRENKINIKILKDKLHRNKCNLYLYHSFNDMHFSGRWYHIDFPLDNLDVKKNKLVIKFNKNWEDFDSGKLTSAILTITLSDKGLDTIQKLKNNYYKNCE